MLSQIMRNQFRAVPFVVTGVVLGLASLGCGLLFAIRLDMGVAGIFLGILTAETLVLVVRTVLTRNAYARPVTVPCCGPCCASVCRWSRSLSPSGSSPLPTASSWARWPASTELGYYSVAVTVTVVFTVLSTAVSQAWLPRALQLYEHDKGRAALAVGTSLTYLVAARGCSPTGIAALAPEVTALLAGSEYAPAAKAIPLLCLGSVAYGTTSITASGMTMTHRTGRLAGISIAAVVTTSRRRHAGPPSGSSAPQRRA